MSCGKRCSWHRLVVLFLRQSDEVLRVYTFLLRWRSRFGNFKFLMHFEWKEVESGRIVEGQGSEQEA